jgi:hypothetical protein
MTYTAKAARMKPESLYPHKLAQRLRGLESHPEALQEAIEWLEAEARDLAKLERSVTHEAMRGRVTFGAVKNF